MTWSHVCPLMIVLRYWIWMCKSNVLMRLFHNLNLTLCESESKFPMSWFVSSRCRRCFRDVSTLRDCGSGSRNILPRAVTRNEGQVAGGDWQGIALKEVEAALLDQTAAGKQATECVHPLSLLLPGRFYHSEECCTFTSWRTTSPQYHRVQC